MKHVLLITTLLLPTVVWGGSDFVPLVGIPFVEDGRTQSLGEYVNALYTAAIAIAAVLAVLRIIFSGIQYMLSDIVTQKSQAKKNIFNALIGLILIIAAWLILSTINDQLVNLDALDNFDNPSFQLTTNINQQGRDTIFDEICTRVSGSTDRNCSIIVCDEFLDWESGKFLDYISLGTNSVAVDIAEYFTERVSCKARCELLGGEVYSKILDSGLNAAPSIECVHPNNPAERIGARFEDIITNADTEEEEIKKEEEDDIDAGEYAKIIARYQQPINWTELSAAERQAIIDNWAEDCEVGPDGEDTGYEFKEIDDRNTAISEVRRICVVP